MKKELCESESSQLVEGTHWGLKGELCVFRNPWTTRGQQDWAQKVPPCPIPPTANTFHSQGSKLGSQTLQAKNAQCPQKATPRALETFPDEKSAQGLGMPWEWELFKTFQRAGSWESCNNSWFPRKMKDSLFSQIPVSSQCIRAVVPGDRGKISHGKKASVEPVGILDERKDLGCVLAESSEDRLERNCSCLWEVGDEQQPWI